MACKQDNETELIQCPYEPSHMIMRKRFQVHLGRCRRNHKQSTKVTCPFNVTHLVNKEELSWHAETCVDRLTFEMFKHREAPAVKVVEPPTPTAVIESSENWDDDPPAPTYNPREYVTNAKVLRHFQGGTPSERKQFRAQERLRHLEFEKKNSDGSL